MRSLVKPDGFTSTLATYPKDRNLTSVCLLRTALGSASHAVLAGTPTRPLNDVVRHKESALEIKQAVSIARKAAAKVFAKWTKHGIRYGHVPSGNTGLRGFGLEKCRLIELRPEWTRCHFQNASFKWYNNEAFLINEAFRNAGRSK